MAKKCIFLPSRDFKLTIQLDVDMQHRLITKLEYFLLGNMDLEGL